MISVQDNETTHLYFFFAMCSPFFFSFLRAILVCAQYLFQDDRCTAITSGKLLFQERHSDLGPARFPQTRLCWLITQAAIIRGSSPPLTFSTRSWWKMCKLFPPAGTDRPRTEHQACRLITCSSAAQNSLNKGPPIFFKRGIWSQETDHLPAVLYYNAERHACINIQFLIFGCKGGASLL